MAVAAVRLPIETLAACIFHLAQNLLCKCIETLAHARIRMLALLKVNHRLIQLHYLVRPIIKSKILQLAAFGVLDHGQRDHSVLHEELKGLIYQLIVDVFKFLLAEARVHHGHLIN